jgi:hypothetical protein
MCSSISSCINSTLRVCCQISISIHYFSKAVSCLCPMGRKNIKTNLLSALNSFECPVHSINNDLLTPYNKRPLDLDGPHCLPKYSPICNTTAHTHYSYWQQSAQMTLLSCLIHNEPPHVFDLPITWHWLCCICQPIWLENALFLLAASQTTM